MSNPARPIAFVQASWHHDIVDQARLGFTERIREYSQSDRQLEIFYVPGAFEIPLMVKRLARSGRFEAIAAAALVVDGGIYRHEFVAGAVIDGLMRVQLDTDVPILSVVLTPHQFHEHDEHLSYFRAHFRKKGAEAAEACIKVLQTVTSRQ